MLWILLIIVGLMLFFYLGGVAIRAVVFVGCTLIGLFGGIVDLIAQALGHEPIFRFEELCDDDES